MASPGDVLVFSFIGYLPQEITVGESTVINVAMRTDVQALDEVVVIGYGTVKKSDATGSVSAISSKDFNKGAITSAQDLLVGKSAGVVITTSGGAPGSGATIRVRGDHHLMHQMILSSLLTVCQSTIIMFQEAQTSFRL